MKKLKWIMKYMLPVLGLIFLAIYYFEIMPAGFWTGFHKDLIITKNSDQGPWGGRREISWKSGTIHTFTDKELIEFAEKNDWKLLDSISVFAKTSTESSFSKLRNDGYSRDILKEIILPKMKTTDIRIFIFETTWLAVEPGNTRETFQNGFAVLSSDGTELKIYHLWGE